MSADFHSPGDYSYTSESSCGAWHVVPYYSLQELAGVSNLRLPIKQIVVGPTPHKTLNIASAKSLLEASGHAGVAVTASTTPFRP